MALDSPVGRLLQARRWLSKSSRNSVTQVATSVDHCTGR